MHDQSHAMKLASYYETELDQPNIDGFNKR